jgi:hypothetical protein
MQPFACLAKSTCLLVLLALWGCQSVPAPGGGHVPGAPDPVQDPGQPADPGGLVVTPAVVDALSQVPGKGMVMLVRPNGQTEPLRGVELSVVADGRTISLATTDDRGIYRVQLKRGRQNSITARKSGYKFEPSTVFATPHRPEVLPEIQARLMTVSLPGAGGQMDDPVIPGQNQPGALQGTVTIRLQMDAAAQAIHRDWGHSVKIMDSRSNTLSVWRVNGNATSFTYQGRVGETFLFEPVTRGGIRSTPRTQRVRISHRPQSISFDLASYGQPPASQPNLRPVAAPQAAATPTPVFSPMPRPTPRPSPGTNYPILRRPAAPLTNP